MEYVIRQQKRQIILIGAITVFFCVLCFALPSHANAADQEVQLSLGIVEGMLYRFATAIGGVFLWLAGTLFDITITSLVIGMGDWLNNASLGGTVDALWIVIRDIFNILFIFGLIYIGFRTILGIGDSNTQRAVVFLIGAALLINFSLYFTKAIIDFSNVAAYQIYNMIQVTPEGSANSGQLRGISDAFMQYSSLSSYADPNTDLLNRLSEEAGWLPSGRIIAYAFLMMIFMLVAAFVFLAGSILLIARFIALILFMIFSPIMFLGWIMPGFSSWSTKWWKQFLNYAFVAPAFLFMIYLSLRVLQQYDVAGGSFAAAFTPDSTDDGFTSIFLNFFVIMGFLWASLMVARHMGAVGASQAVNIGKAMGKKAQVYAGNASFGLTAAGLRSTAGRWAQGRADSEALKEKAAQSGWRGFAARRQLDVARYGGSASFDARRVGGAGKKLGLGEGTKGGYSARRDAKIKKDKEYAKSLGEVGDEDPEVARLNKIVKDTESSIKKLKKAKALAKTPEEKEKAQEEIDVAEERLKEERLSAKREKSRRQLGSESNIRDHGSYAELKQSRQFATGTLDVLHANYRQATDQTEKQRLAEKIKEQQQSLGEIDAKMRKHTGGYAALVEQTGWFVRTFTNRNKDINRSAAEAIRKEHEKKIKKTKEDERFDTISEKLEKATKKDES